MAAPTPTPATAVGGGAPCCCDGVLSRTFPSPRAVRPPPLPVPLLLLGTLALLVTECAAIGEQLAADSLAAREGAGSLQRALVRREIAISPDENDDARPQEELRGRRGERSASEGAAVEREGLGELGADENEALELHPDDGPGDGSDGKSPINHHLLRSTATDYRPDVRKFVEAHKQSPCPLRRTDHSEASQFFARQLKKAIATTGEDPPNEQPWAGSLQKAKASAETSAYTAARLGFSSEMFHGKPGVIEGVAREWPALERWRSREALRDRLHGKEIKLSTFVYPDAIYDADGVPSMQQEHIDYESLATYIARNHSDRNLFYFINEPEDQHHDGDFGSNRAALELLRADAAPLPSFAASQEEHHAVVALDGVGSSHGLHRHGPVWQTQVLGRKAWFLLDPSVHGGTPTDSVGSHDDLEDRTPVVDGRLFAHPDACEFLWRRPPPPGATVCIVHPGETLLLPQDWWHGTCGLDELTAAMGGWLEDRRTSDP